MANETMVRESKIDWITIGLYLAMVIVGWFNLYSTSSEADPSFINTTTFHGKQAIFLLISIGMGALVLFLDTKFLEFTSYILYGLVLTSLVAVIFYSRVTSGANSWFEIGGFKIQPTEFAKVTTVMALAQFMSRYNFSLKNRSDVLITLAIIVVPMILVLAQNDAGSALVFASLILVLYREGMHPLILVGLIVLVVVGTVSLLFSTTRFLPVYLAPPIFAVIGASYFYLFRRRFLALHIVVALFLIAIPFSVTKVVKPYQSARFRVLVASEAEINPPKNDSTGIKPDSALKKVYYNYMHSLVAVGSGGLWGKGYGNSTHTRGNFVPEEHTDYIHCVFSEEHGFVGSTILLIVYFLMVARVVYIAENSKTAYARILGYGVAVIFMIHIVVNIGMSVGVVPTIGIPLPFFSYGGSAIISFSMMFFILINHYSYRMNIL